LGNSLLTHSFTKQKRRNKEMMGERLQKVLASLGLGSRRKMEEWIQQGRVHVNKEVAILGCRVTLKDNILLDGKLLRLPSAKQSEAQFLLYHKPVGELCTRFDEEKRPTVFDHLPKPRSGRWILVGRLDYNTSGLLLLTTDGQLADMWMHPRTQIEREYACRVIGPVPTVKLEYLQKGVILDDGPAAFKSIAYAGGEGMNVWYKVVLTEGRNREVRRLWESQHITVNRLIRIRYGTLCLPRDLRAGHHRFLSDVTL
jgi:23S rRNA pseudouridine2605 synthase